MLVLDENLPLDQQHWLRKWRIRFRVVGLDVGAFGAPDESLLPVMQKPRQPTFFTLDQDFYQPAWAHARYCLVWLDVQRRDAAGFVRRFLRHPGFDTRAGRMGIIARVKPEGIRFWRVGARAQQSLPWPPQ